MVDYLKIKKTYSDELYHHGVKGQRWGVRNEKDKPTGKQRVKRAAIGGAIGLGAGIASSYAVAGGIAAAALFKSRNPLETYNRIAPKAVISAVLAGPLLGATIGALKKNKQKNDINHSGIKGMKWGVRRYQNEDGTLTDAGKARYNPDLTKKKVEKMSDADLNKANQRLSAERTYYNLTGKNYKNRSSNADIAIKAGASAIGSAMLSAGAYLIRAKSKNPEVALGKSAMKTAGLLAILGASIGSISSVATSLGGQANIQNIGDQKKKK